MEDNLGIYNSGFLDYLRDNLGEPVKHNIKDIVVNCPWCDVHKNSSKPHLWISKEAPIFHCFRAACERSGFISKLIKELSGSDTSDTFVNKERVKYFAKQKVEFEKNVFVPKNILLPEIKQGEYPEKEFYLKQRFKFSDVKLYQIPGLVFDIHEFVRINKLELDPKIQRLQHYLHTNFIGFLTEYKSTLILRNIDRRAEFRYYKLRVQESKFMDFYKLNGFSKLSNIVILSEGIFDIFTEHIFDKLNLKKSCRLYASALSSKFSSLIKSIVFHEMIFKPEIHILSDNGIPLDNYKKLKYYNSHIINKMIIYYNRTGKDFNDTPLVLDYFTI